jgi:hypothetical protein
VLATSSPPDDEPANKFWDCEKVLYTITLLETASYDYMPTRFTGFLEIAVQSMIYFNSDATLVALLRKPILLNIFFWSMFKGALKDSGFPPKYFSISSPSGEIKYQIEQAIDGIKSAVNSGLIPDSELTQKSIKRFKDLLKSPYDG